MSYSLSRSATHVFLFMGIVSLASLLIADYAADPMAYVLLGVVGVVCIAMSFFFRRFCKCPHCGKSIIRYRYLPPACPHCEQEITGVKP